jgi:hypothetical protein
MKKVYLSMLAIALGITSVSAQELFTMPRHPADLDNNTSAPKALGTPFWTDNFDTPADWTFDNQGQTASNFGWNIDATVDTWATNSAGAINSISGGNYAEVSNGDPTQAPSTAIPGAIYTMTTATSIDIAALSGGNTAALSWMQNGAKFTDLQEVQVSTDGAIFTTVYDNDEREALTASGGAAYANPETITVNISDEIAANPATVWIRFSVTTSATNGIMYGWNIDDVVLSTLPDFDISYSQIYWGTADVQYFQIPTNQIAPIDFSVNVANNGGQDLTGVSLELSNTGTVVESTTPTTLAVGATDSLFVTFTPAGAGTYTLSRDVVMNEVDDIPGNNVFAPIATIEVGGNIYARDEGTIDGDGGGDDGSGNFGYEAGSYYDVYTDDVLGAMQIGVADDPANVGKEIYGILYLFDGSFVAQAVTDAYTVTQADLGEIVTIPVQGGFDLIAGTTYFAAVGCTDEFYYATAGDSPDQLSLIFYPTMSDPAQGTNFFTTGTPIVRLYMGGVGIDEDASLAAGLGQNAPNPFSANSTITFELQEASEVSFEIRNLSGQLVKSFKLGNLNAGTQSLEISAAELAAGAYTYTMIAGNKSATKRMIIQK